MPLYEALLRIIGKNPVLPAVLAVCLVSVGALLFNRIVIQNEILNTPTYVNALAYVLLSACAPALLQLHPALIANVLLLLASHKVMSSHRMDAALGKAFDAGLFVALASLFYFPSAFFLLFIWIGLVIIRPFIWREWMMALAGFCLPWLFTAVVYFLADDLSPGLTGKFKGIVWQKVLRLDLTVTDHILLAAAGLLFLLSLGKLYSGALVSTVRARNNFSVFLWFLLISLGSLAAAPALQLKYAVPLVIPASLIVSNYLVSVRKKWWAETLVAVFLLAIAARYLIDFS